MKRSEKIAALAELVWEHGDAVDDRDDYGELLRAANVTPTEASQFIDRARQEAHKMLKREARQLQGLRWKPEPTLDPAGTSDHWNWETECGTYRVAAMVDKNDKLDNATFGACIKERDEDGEEWQVVHWAGTPPRPVRHKSLIEALEACHGHWRAQAAGREKLISDHQNVLDGFERLRSRKMESPRSCPQLDAALGSLLGKEAAASIALDRDPDCGTQPVWLLQPEADQFGFKLGSPTAAFNAAIDDVERNEGRIAHKAMQQTGTAVMNFDWTDHLERLAAAGKIFKGKTGYRLKQAGDFT
jgi:hypothetical protein